MTPLKLRKNAAEALKVVRELVRARAGGRVEARVAADEAKLDYAGFMGAAHELQGHGLVELEESGGETLRLTDEGTEYAKRGLPERRMIDWMVSNGVEEIPVTEFLEKVGLEPRFFYIGLSNLKKRRWVAVSKATERESAYPLVKESPPPTALEELINWLAANGPAVLDSIPEGLKGEVATLRRRKLVKVDKGARRYLVLTELGARTVPEEVQELVEMAQLTPELLATGKWREVSFKPFNVEALGPRLFGGRIHPMVMLINEVREIFLSMGFTEIRGPVVESAFYNFDALFVPQDHPAREMHDTFYLSRPSRTKLPAKVKVENVRKTHEDGWKTGSRGWRYRWSREEAERALLRTHTTATTVRYLDEVVKSGAKLPVKVFSIDRVFRNEKVDQSHLAEFHQIEGIVVAENATLADLIGTLTSFYHKMGFKKVITRPGFFPYTEPSMQISVYAEKINKWLEMGGSGIFRPEVCAPWGIEEPVRVLAWGMGLERLAMFRFAEITDIRDLFRSPVGWLREVPV
ncbi:MAG: phenylalanine--tRNA ligase subunit alpha [Promethearchaeota archaeon]